MVNYTLRQLQAFVEVARESSVSRAAERLFVTQPAVSMQLRQLEEAFGVPLVEPVGRNIRLTHAGQDFHRHALAALSALKDLEATMADHVGMKHGRLDLAVVTTAKYFVPMLLMRFRALHPGIDVTLRVENRERVLGMLSRSEVDLVVMGGARPRRCAARPRRSPPTRCRWCARPITRWRGSARCASSSSPRAASWCASRARARGRRWSASSAATSSR